MKDIKSIAVIVVLCILVVFLFMDKCGSSGKLDKLKGQYKEQSKMADLERQISKGIIKKQNKIIEKQDLLIAEANKEVEIKKSLISSLDNTVADLEGEFGDLLQEDAKIGNLLQQVEVWKEKFSLAQSIIADKDDVIFSLNEKYNAQFTISEQYKKMYETLRVNTKTLQKIVTTQDWQIKKLKLFSNAKTGIVVLLVAATIYGLVK